MIFSFSHNHIGMMIHAGQNTPFKKDTPVFIDRYSITSCQYFSYLSGDAALHTGKIQGFFADIAGKEEYIHG